MQNERQKKQQKEWVKRKLAEDPDYFKNLGSKGGKAKVPSKGFGMMSITNPEKHRQASSKGGTESNKKSVERGWRDEHSNTI